MLGFKQWMSVIKKKRSLRYFPPNFQVRNPKVELVSKTFNDGKEVAAIVFQAEQSKDEVEATLHWNLIIEKNRLEAAFVETVRELFTEDDILYLNTECGIDYLLLLKVDQPNLFLTKADVLVNTIIDKMNEKTGFSFYSGYMFIEKGLQDLNTAIYRAHNQARIISERKLSAKYSELNYELGKVIDEKDIQLLAQPIIDVSTNKIKAWEILTRGPSTSNFSEPLKLFSLARQMNKLYELELIVLSKALKQVVEKKCKQVVFINLIPITLGNMNFVEDVSKLFSKYPELSPSQFVFEITERESVDVVPNIFDNLKLLREKGFKIAVDDTGAGYANLHMISEVRPDIIKIDRSVIQDIDTNKVKETMLKGLLYIAKEINSIVVAEGIETREEAAVLSRNNVDLAQGYFYAKPNILPNMTA